MENGDFYLYNDRHDDKYLQFVANLLSFDQLLDNALTDKNDKNPVVTIKFSGLSAMTLLGGGNAEDKNPAYEAFNLLISNKNNLITELNRKNIAVHIKLLFAYPYSDFYYDLIQAEEANSEGNSVSCVINKEDFVRTTIGPKVVKYSDVKSSKTYASLKQSLSNLLTAKNDAVFNKNINIGNNINKNKVVVKFTPVNGMCCFLQINNTIFLDSYLFAKQKANANKLSLISPIVRINAMRIGKVKQLPDKEQEKIHKELNQRHYYSALSHFRYFWNHDLTLYMNDVCVTKEKKITIVEPHLVSYFNKAERLLEKYHYSLTDIDIWKQRVKDEFKRYTSKFHEESFHKESFIKLFIVGAWNDNIPNQYMETLAKMLTAKFRYNKHGLKIKPEVVKVGVGDNIQETVYYKLKTSHIGCVIQTADIKIGKNKWMSKPNIYLEKGYLISQLGQYKNHRNIEKVRVFTFIEKGVVVESNNINTAPAEFLNESDFELQFFKIIYWLWEMTELNTDSALLFMEQERILLEQKKEYLLMGSGTSKEINRINDFLSRHSDQVKDMSAYINEKKGLDNEA